jgi:hypothetical protein
MGWARCDGVITTDANGVPSCTDGLGVTLAWVNVEPFQPSDVDPAIAGQLFAGGFVVYGVCWVMGRAVRALLQAIK